MVSTNYPSQLHYSLFLLQDFLSNWSALLEASGRTTADQRRLLYERADAWFDFSARRCSGKRATENEVSLA